METWVGAEPESDRGGERKMSSNTTLSIIRSRKELQGDADAVYIEKRATIC